MQTKKRWAAVALLAAGIAIGIVMVATPAAAHVGGSVNHLWNHLKPKADKRYVNENELLWAVVNADPTTPTIARGNGVASVTKSGVGNYVVAFNRNVRQCVYSATIGLSGASGTEDDGFTTVVGAAANVNAVFVETDDTTGTESDNLSFHLIVNCGTTGSPARVVVPRTEGDGLENQG
ncbi:MAG TPA: hypothetical protein VLA87_12650 [Gaiellaceae bacterium]|nr:hypothetical protein [Gaiellaceae bacterium]